MDASVSMTPVMIFGRSIGRKKSRSPVTRLTAIGFVMIFFRLICDLSPVMINTPYVHCRIFKIATKDAT